jgi:hypothetical protein
MQLVHISMLVLIRCGSAARLGYKGRTESGLAIDERQLY